MLLLIRLISGRELDSVNNICSQILRRCFPKNKLPVPCLSSPLSFPLLDLDSAATNTGADQEEMDESGEGEGESSDLESEEDTSGGCKEDKEGGTGSKCGDQDEENQPDGGNKRQKPRDDLQMYGKFFPEQYEYQVYIKLTLLNKKNHCSCEWGLYAFIFTWSICAI